MISDETTIADTLNQYFAYITKILNLRQRKLHCQKCHIGAKTAKAFLKSGLK